MEHVIEFDRESVSIRMLTENEIRRKYADETLKVLYQDGYAIVNNHVEIYFEGCYTPHITLTLET